MSNGIAANIAQLPGLPITVVAFLALLTAFTTAQGNLTTTKAKGLKTLRNTKRDALWTAMGLIKAYVQSLSDTMSAENGAALIQATGLVVAVAGKRVKAVLTAKLTTVAGVVHLEANASTLLGSSARRKKAYFNWQYSLDGKTWTSVPATNYARVDITGLTALTTYSFRVGVTVGSVVGEWSQPVTILVTH